MVGCYPTRASCQHWPVCKAWQGARRDIWGSPNPAPNRGSVTRGSTNPAPNRGSLTRDSLKSAPNRASSTDFTALCLSDCFKSKLIITKCLVIVKTGEKCYISPIWSVMERSIPPCLVPPWSISCQILTKIKNTVLNTVEPSLPGPQTRKLRASTTLRAYAR